MQSKSIRVLAGGLLAGALALGTAGLVAAQDPTPKATPTPSGWVGPRGMMGTGGGMMGAGGGMMGTGGGMMGTDTMDEAHHQEMATMHDQMAAGTGCDPSHMGALHPEPTPSR